MVMLYPSELSIAVMSDSRASDMITMLDPCLGLEMLADPHLVLTIMSYPCLGLVPNIIAKPKTQRSLV